MPIVISDDLVIGTGPAEVLPLDHPRILYDDIVRDATLTPSTEAEGFEAENAANGLTWDFWRPTAMPATLQIDTEEAAPVDYALIAAHSLGTAGAAGRFAYHNGAAWVNLTAEFAPGTDRVLAFFFNEVTASRFRLTLTGATPASVGVVMLGKALAVERKLFRGHVPITLGRKTLIKPQTSEGGQWLGRSIQRDGVATSIGFQNLTGDWVRDSFDPFILSARKYPFGWAWRPGDYPEEVAYVWTSADINPQNTGPGDLMSTTFKVSGIVD